MFENDHGVDDPPKMNGSWMLIRDVNLQAARTRLEGDIYVTGGAWDMSKVRHFISTSLCSRYGLLISPTQRLRLPLSP